MSTILPFSNPRMIPTTHVSIDDILSFDSLQTLESSPSITVSIVLQFVCVSLAFLIIPFLSFFLSFLEGVLQ